MLAFSCVCFLWLHNIWGSLQPLDIRNNCAHVSHLTTFIHQTVITICQRRLLLVKIVISMSSESTCSFLILGELGKLDDDFKDGVFSEYLTTLTSS